MGRLLKKQTNLHLEASPCWSRTITVASTGVKYPHSRPNQLHFSSAVKDLKLQLLRPPRWLSWISQKERGAKKWEGGWESNVMKENKNESVKRSRKRRRQGQAAPSGAFVLLAKGPPGAGGNRWHHCVKRGGGGRGLCCLLSPWQQVYLCVCVSVRFRQPLPHLCLYCKFSCMWLSCLDVWSLFPSSWTVSPSKMCLLIWSNSNFPLFPHPFPPSLPFSSPPLHSFQHSAESILSGLVVCPLKRSGGITPLIPLWQNKG